MNQTITNYLKDFYRQSLELDLRVRKSNVCNGKFTDKNSNIKNNSIIANDHLIAKLFLYILPDRVPSSKIIFLISFFSKKILKDKKINTGKRINIKYLKIHLWH